MSKNVVETEGQQMTSQYGAYALYAGYARLHARTRMHTHPETRTHTQICNIYCLFHCSNDWRTRLCVTLQVYCLSCFANKSIECSGMAFKFFFKPFVTILGLV